jgi:hypothetical protein
VQPLPSITPLADKLTAEAVAWVCLAVSIRIIGSDLICKIRWGLKTYDFCGRVPFGNAVSYSPAEERVAWSWFVEKINEKPAVLQEIRKEVWDPDEGISLRRGTKVEDLGDCPIESDDDDEP